jgi:uncharacterized damage-inducible protein DinB
MPDTPEFLAERLKTEGERTISFFANLSPDQWQSTVYTDGGEWRVRDVLAHFFSAERRFLELFRDVQAGGPGAPQDFDIDGFNAGQVGDLRETSPAELLAAFRAAREAMIAWVSTCSADDLQRIGRHPFLGQTTLADMVKMVYRHHQIHFRDFRASIS